MYQKPEESFPLKAWKCSGQHLLEISKACKKGSYVTIKEYKQNHNKISTFPQQKQIKIPFSARDKYFLLIHQLYNKIVEMK